MAKIIKYKMAIEAPCYEEVEILVWNEEEQTTILTTEIQQITNLDFYNRTVTCSNEEEFLINLPIAMSEAYNGEYTIEGEYDT